MELIIELAHFIRNWWPILTAIGGLFYGVFQGFSTINNTLIDINYQLKRSNERFEETRKDIEKLWAKIETHDIRIDELESHADKNSELINYLKERK